MRLSSAGLLLLCFAGLPTATRAQEPFEISPVDAGLFRGRAPRWRSEFEQLRATGMRTVLDVRAFRPIASRREARLAAEFGLCYRHVRYPALPWALEETEDVYRQLLRTQDYPLFVHCQQNRDRTSLLFGLYRVRVQGWLPAAAYEEMERFGLRQSLPYIGRYFWENTYGPGMPGR